jgi:ketosteroid isomerase-like protein
MKKILLLSLIIFASLNISAQSNLQKIYDTEKAFEKAAAERGINQAFIEFSTTDSTCFFPGYPVNCIEYFKSRPANPAGLYWNPTFIDVSSNGALGYSTGNSVFKPKGKDDTAAYYGEYATIWQRQPDGNYKSVLDLGISHDAQNTETKWTSPADTGKELNEKRYSAADSSTAFFEMTTKQGLSKAYKTYFAEDVRILREGKTPIVGKKAALEALKDYKYTIAFAKRSVFVGAADMAYINNTYTATDRNGKTVEKGNFLQVWKLRNNRWQIVFDVFLPSPPEQK